jgi:hypothetical protein
VQADLEGRGVWSDARRHLLDLYVTALRDEREQRALARKADAPAVHLAAADRERKAAVQLADALGLTARAAKALQTVDTGAGRPAGAYDGRFDELGARRKRRGAS